MHKKVCLIGLGPHAKRIYINYLKKHKLNLALVVELASKEESVEKYLREKGNKNTEIFTINDKYKDFKNLPKEIEKKLIDCCMRLGITHIIISTEPKAHNMYIEFALKYNINVLTDKPITVTKNMTSKRSIKEIKTQYNKILKMAKNSIASCNVMCQRQYHKGYEYVKEVLSEVVTKYQVPITYIDIYHCDGNWEMPHDLLKENHPYKYGYGKLFHSGYHFIDLLSDFIKINDNLTEDKRIKKGEIYSNIFTPNDELAVFNIDDYNRIFHNQDIPKYYKMNATPKFKKFGEKNFYGMMRFSNFKNQTITNVNLNLLHYGFSRRGWINSKDYYKENGRIRHERINIQVGPLLNIQIHSYQSKEIKDRIDNQKCEEQVGGLEHFDIDIYRNVDVIGGQPYERIKLGDLYTDKKKKDMLGYNELSREEYLTKFLSGKCDKGAIRNQKLAIEILASCAKGIYNHYHGKNKSERIKVKGTKSMNINIKELKDYSYKDGYDLSKECIKIFSKEKIGYEFASIINKLKDNDCYEVYGFVRKANKSASGLLYKMFKTRIGAEIYFRYLKYKILNQSLIKSIYIKGQRSSNCKKCSKDMLKI